MGGKRIDWIIESMVIKAIKQNKIFATRSVKQSDRLMYTIYN